MPPSVGPAARRLPPSVRPRFAAGGRGGSASSLASTGFRGCCAVMACAPAQGVRYELLDATRCATALVGRACVDGTALVRSPPEPGSRPAFAQSAHPPRQPEQCTLHPAGGWHGGCAKEGCGRPLFRAQEAHLRTRSVSPQRQALLAARAASMRADSSPPERLLWAALVNRKLGVSPPA
jgi:hypothetical protein